jgi:hypothetical protein
MFSFCFFFAVFLNFTCEQGLVQVQQKTQRQKGKVNWQAMEEIEEEGRNSAKVSLPLYGPTISHAILRRGVERRARRQNPPLRLTFSGE